MPIWFIYVYTVTQMDSFRLEYLTWLYLLAYYGT